MRSTVRTTWLLALLVCAMAAYAEEAAPEAAPPPDPGPTPIKQVQMHVWISETNETGLKDLGANLSYTRFVRGVEESGSVQQVNTNVFDPTAQGVVLPAPDQNLFPAPMRPDLSGNLNDGLQTVGGIGLVASILDMGTGTIDGVFRAIETNTDIDLISKPELLVIDGTDAEIHAGGQVPYQDIKYDKGQPQLNVVWRDIGVNMKIQPVILPNDFVQINIVNLDVSDIASIENIRGIDLPVFSKRSQTGEVIVPNGGMFVIGGLESYVQRSSERGVPLVSRVPILGIPFRSRSAESSNTSLLVFVAPTVVDLRALPGASDDLYDELLPGEDRARAALNFWQDWQNKERVATEIDSMEMVDEL
ncbi:MAG TPA: type II and III secretion system protein [Candidatus Hydrogenedentes bacterium]|mgnify:CR=1 FL=1|nr:type II and III secretion system protein [Candidatus Hydrogenedentota bacterium]HPG69094.1 type II and III secretion system protein [Candidatus Hydrogenedentota bacterium]